MVLVEHLRPLRLIPIRVRAWLCALRKFAHDGAGVACLFVHLGVDVGGGHLVRSTPLIQPLYQLLPLVQRHGTQICGFLRIFIIIQLNITLLGQTLQIYFDAFT